MNDSVRLVEQALEYLQRQDLDSYLSLLSPSAAVGVNDGLPEPRSADLLRVMLADEQVLRYRVDGVVLGESDTVTVQVLHRHHIVGTGWVRWVYWVRGGRIERIQLGKLFIPGRVWYVRSHLPDFLSGPISLLTRWFRHRR